MDSSSSATYATVHSSGQDTASFVEHDGCVESCTISDNGVHTSGIQETPTDLDKMTTLPSLEDTTRAFTYSSLDLKNQSIRLIQLVPELSSDGHIQCNICNSSIDDTYTCLSYEWGIEAPDRTIVVDDALFPVRKNLWDFLDVARRRHHARWLWIDALCIDQSNLRERNHQVQQMGRIYEQAQEIFSWLGTNALISNYLVLEPQSISRGRFMEEIKEFTNLSYWKRAWITQEIVLARHVTLMACDSELDMLHTERGVIYRQKSGALYPDPKYWPKSRGRSLIHLLREFGSKQCTAYQDRVFSLLALCGEGSTLQVDYQLTRQQLAVQVLRSCERLLCFCSFAFVARALDLDTTKVQKSALDKATESSSLSMAFAQLSVPLKQKYNGTESMEVVLCRDESCLDILGSARFRKRHPFMFPKHPFVPSSDITEMGLDDGVMSYLSEDCSSLNVTFTFVDLLRLSKFYNDHGPCHRLGLLEDDQSLRSILKLL